MGGCKKGVTECGKKNKGHNKQEKKREEKRRKKRREEEHSKRKEERVKTIFLKKKDELCWGRGLKKKNGFKNLKNYMSARAKNAALRKRAALAAMSSTLTAKRVKSHRSRNRRPPTAVDVVQHLARFGTRASARSVRRDVGPRADVVRKHRKAAAERRRRLLVASAALRGGWT